MRYLLVLSTILSATILLSCSKSKLEKKADSETYYSEDFKTVEGQILGIETSEIDYLWAEYFVEKDKSTHFKLIVKHEGEMSYEEGILKVDEELNMTLIPKNGGSSYFGQFNIDKTTYTVNLPGVSARSLTFLLKDK